MPNRLLGDFGEAHISSGFAIRSLLNYATTFYVCCTLSTVHDSVKEEESK